MDASAMVWIEQTQVGSPTRKFALYLLGLECVDGHIGTDDLVPRLAKVAELSEDTFREELRTLVRDGLITWQVGSADGRDWVRVAYPGAPKRPRGA